MGRAAWYSIGVLVPMWFGLLWVGFMRGVVGNRAIEAAYDGRARVVSRFLQITDPQLGMKTFLGPGYQAWDEEKEMLQRLVAGIPKISDKFDFFFIGGDMQNFWPNEKRNGEPDIGRNKPTMPSPPTDPMLGGIGEQQRRDVAAAVAGLSPKVYTPGNHDVGDAPDAATLRLYDAAWGHASGTHGSRVLEGQDAVMYLQLNSQYYQTDMEDDKAKQWSFLEQQLKKIDKARTKLVVLLTHIPPFMHDIDEGDGWANWRRSDRINVLDRVTAELKARMAAPKLLWVCGHFHANARNRAAHNGVPMDIIVSSAAGSTLHWAVSGAPSNDLSSTEAMQVAQTGVQEAFGKFIIGGDVGNIGKRLIVDKAYSGVRAVEVYDDGTFKDTWWTAKDLEGIR